MKKPLYGVGINDVDYMVRETMLITTAEGITKRVINKETACPFYNQWCGVLKRCYSPSFKKQRPSYAGVTHCPEWTYLSKYTEWAKEQDWQGKCLDKDIIVYGNKIYGPETCAFVTKMTNNFVLESGVLRGDCPLGVYFCNQRLRYVARGRNPFTGKMNHICFADCPKEAHEAWRKRKHELAQLVAETESDPRVVEALKKRYSYEEWYKHNPI